MLNELQEFIIPHIRTFKIENIIPRVKISLFDEKSKLEIKRIFMPIESNIFENENNKIQSLNEQKSLPKQEIKFLSTNFPLTSHETNFNKESSSKIQQIMNTIDHQEVIISSEMNFDYLTLRCDQLFYEHVIDQASLA